MAVDDTGRALTPEFRTETWDLPSTWNPEDVWEEVMLADGMYRDVEVVELPDPMELPEVP
jgi:hypothetical protein